MIVLACGVHLVFDAEDVAETRFAISPMRHAVFAALCAHHPELAAPGSLWREIGRGIESRSVPLLELIGHAGARSRLLGDLLWIEPPPLGTGRNSMGDELDALMDLDRTPATWEYSGDLWRLMRGTVDPALIASPERITRVMADGLYVLFHRFIAPEWRSMRRHMENDLHHRAEVALGHGMGAALASLSPRLRWEDSSLYIGAAGTGKARLRGHGLSVGPIVSAARGYLSVVLSSDARRSLMSYPVPGDRSTPEHTPRIDTLGALVGAPRGRALRAIGSGCRTGELASRLGVSPSTASEHATVLRNAGLIVTRREGRAVRHVLSPLGAKLLASN